MTVEKAAKRKQKTLSETYCGIIMYAFAALVISGLAVSCPPVLIEEEEDLSKGTLVWWDEFDGTELDPARWNVETGTGVQYGGGINGWGNNEKQYYKRENLRVEDGVLVIEARKDNTGPTADNFPYTSAKITTKSVRPAAGEPSGPNGDGLKFAAGPAGGVVRVEARIKSSNGVGFWPAFWLLGNGSNGVWPRCGEIDILEIVGGQENTLHQTIHHGTAFPNAYWYKGRSYLHTESLANDWHVYGVFWNNTELNFTFDDTVTRTIPLGSLAGGAQGHPESFWDPAGFGIIFNLAVGGNFIGNKVPPDTVFTGGPLEDRCLKVDWVRVYWK